jgi:hypothetical protein
VHGQGRHRAERAAEAPAEAKGPRCRRFWIADTKNDALATFDVFVEISDVKKIH